MHALLVPVSQPRLDFHRAFRLSTSFHLGEKEGKLLTKSVKALPPMTTAMLVAIAGEQVVEKFKDVYKHGFVML